MKGKLTEVSYKYGTDLIPPPGSHGEGMWRWRNLLPLDGRDLYPVPVGGTPLVASETLGGALGLDSVYIKDETRGPTGSNKDRATALCVADARMKGSAAVACASTGNVAASLSAGGAAVGMPVFVFVAAGVVSPHKAQFMRLLGATVVEVDGSYADAYRLSEEVTKQLDWYSRNTGSNPLTIEGKKTVAFEIWEQLGRRIPDTVFAPVGDGVTLAALYTGFMELRACGATESIPRLMAVQAAGAAPLAAAFAAGTQWEPVVPDTIADGIAVGEPVYGNQAIEAVRETAGTFVTVEDEEISAAVATLARHAGCLTEPAGAAGTAGLAQLAPQHAGEVVVTLVTGTGLKDHRWWPAPEGVVLQVEADIDRFPVDQAEKIIGEQTSGAA